MIQNDAQWGKMANNIQLILEAISFAARKHDGQVRKDGRTPYVSHPIRVMMILSSVFGVLDRQVLAAAALHDVIEDTSTSFNDIENEFGQRIAIWVSLLSKDKQQEVKSREFAYVCALRDAPDEVKLIKLADIYDNLIDAPAADDPKQLAKTRMKAKNYLTIFSQNESESVTKALRYVQELLSSSQ
jgi:guanosine-3',5'-bis(diphosphate) 3'-pyrophosphohydrolase